MKIKPFKLERYFAQHEFSAPYLLSCSDCEPLSQQELMEMADSESIKLWGELSLGYTHSQGHPLLREEVSKLHTKIRAENIVVAAPEECIFIAMNVLLNEGDHVVTTFPAYQSLYEIATSLHANISKWEPNKNGVFNPEDLFGLVKKNTKLIVINFPHNPTGETTTNGELESIVAFAKERNIYLFSDEMYRLLEHDPKDKLPSVCDIYENGISLFGMSKSYALAGLRIGWLITQDKQLIEKLIEFKDYTSICPPAPSEILSIIALRNSEKILSRNLNIIKRNKKLVEDLIMRHPDKLKWRKPLAGPIGFLELNIEKNLDLFCEEMIEEKGVMLLSASIYNYSYPKVRMGLGRKDFEIGLSHFEEYLSAF